MEELVKALEENGWCSIDSGFAKGKINLFVGDGFMSIHYGFNTIASCQLKKDETLLQLFERTKRKAKKLMPAWCKMRNDIFFSDIEKFKESGVKYGVKPTQSELEKFKVDCDGFIAKTSELAVAVKEL